jgi:hypothetical protein
VRHGFEIGERRPQQGRIVLELTDAEIASAAEQPAHLSGDVAVIDAERAGGSLLADGAGAALVLQQHVVVSQRHAVDVFEPTRARDPGVVDAFRRPQRGIFRPLAPPVFIDVILAGRMETAIARKHALSIVRVFRIAPLPGDAVPGGHWRRSP